MNVVTVIVFFAMLPETKGTLVRVVNAASNENEDKIMGVINGICQFTQTKARNVTKAGINLAIEVKVNNQKFLIKD